MNTLTLDWNDILVNVDYLDSETPRGKPVIEAIWYDSTGEGDYSEIPLGQANKRLLAKIDSVLAGLE